MMQMNSLHIYDDLIGPLFKLPVDLPQSPWMGHVPFMFALFQAIKPKTYLELGVHNGCSLLAAATAASLYVPEAKIIGIDSWQGDDHAVYGDGNQILAKLTTTVTAHFTNVDLVRDFFDNHVSKVPDGSIDLLHIDGLHTYEAVKHDYETWLPKLTKRGVILFHDTHVFEQDFGVHRLFSEVAANRPHANFKHSFGLGILALGERSDYPDSFIALLDDAQMFEGYAALAYDVALSLQLRFEAAQHGAIDSYIPRSHEDQSLAIIPGSRSWKLIMALRKLRAKFS